MAYNRPQLTDLIERTRNDIISRLPSPDLLRRSNAEVYARALSGTAHSLYGYLDWLSRQLIYDTAESDILERWASIWGITRKAATTAHGSITFTGSNGAIIAASSQLTAYDGIIYQTVAEATISSGNAIASVYAINTGFVGNRGTGQTLTLQAPIAGVNAGAIAGEITGGTDTETDDSLRSRLLTRIKMPPQGGDKADYEAWALAVPGVTRAWVYPMELGAGTVSVRFMMDAYPNGIPLSGDIAAVASYIDLLRPVTAKVTVLAPNPVPLNFTINSLQPATNDVKTAIIQELTDLIKREAIPGGTLYLSHIREAISISAGEFDHVLTLPSANVVMTTGNISTMGIVTWL